MVDLLRNGPRLIAPIDRVQVDFAPKKLVQPLPGAWNTLLLALSFIIILIAESPRKVPLTKFSSRYRLTQRFGKGRIMSLYFSLLLTIAAMSMMGMFRRVWSWAAIGKREI